MSQPSDPLEREADRLADRVMRMSTDVVPRACSCEEDEAVPRQAARSGGGGTVDGSTLSPGAGGRPLTVPVQSWAASAFGEDFSGVRVHDGPSASAAASSIDARAYTVGSDIVFGAGEYRPESAPGRRLLAHELAHVVQHGRLIARTPATGDEPAPPVSGLTGPMAEQIARALFAAMDGPGTDEEAIYSAFAGRNQAQVDEIAAAYRRLFSRDLQVDLAGELTEGEMRHLAIFGEQSARTMDPTADAGALGVELARTVARQLDAAMDRVGTDEESVYAALTGRTQAERDLIRQEYHALTGRELIADLHSEFSGAELQHALRLFEQGQLEPEDELFLAIAGIGTDEDTVFRVVESLAGNRAAIEQLEERFHTKYAELAGELMSALRSDLSTAEYERALAVLGPVLADVAFEDCDPASVRAEIRAFIPGAIAKVERAISVLEQGWARMSAAERATFNRFYDPSNTGDIDAGFVARVLENFRLIRLQFGHELTVECEDRSAGLCEGARLYYTYGSNVHVCPYFATAPASEADRKARDFVHELAHNAMQAFDRPYYSARTGRYAGDVTPSGPWGTGIPVIGPLIRAIARSDTLYHPDAYSWFAWTI